MKNFTFAIPTTFNHLFVQFSKETPIYYSDQYLHNRINSDEKVKTIQTILPQALKRIEISKVTTEFTSIANTIDYFHLWPFPHMTHAEIITDGDAYTKISLYNDEMRENFKACMEKPTWKKSLFIVYTKKDGDKIGFLLFR